MESKIARIDDALHQEFPGATTELEMLGDKVTGFLLWDGFESQDQIERQRTVWKALQNRMGASVRDEVSMIFPVTPNELTVMREG